MRDTYNQKELLLNCSGNSALPVAQVCDIQTVYRLRESDFYECAALCMWGNGKKRTFLVILANVDGNIYRKGEKRGTYLSASRKMPKVKITFYRGIQALSTQ